MATTLRDLRIRAGLSQTELAKRLGVRQGTVSDLETGKHNPRVETILALARCFKVTPQKVLSAVVNGSSRTTPKR